jgi:hypothetical protein
MPEDEADMASTPPLRVMLVDDHEVVRDGSKALLPPNDDIVVCAEAATVRQAVAEADRSPQEERILELVSTGRTNKQIGEELHLATPPLPAANARPSCRRRRLRGGVSVGVGQWSRSTPAVRPYRRPLGATTTG